MNKVVCKNCGEIVEPICSGDNTGLYNNVCTCPNCGAHTWGWHHIDIALDQFEKGVFKKDETKEVKGKAQQPDMVKHPSHYVNDNGVECQTVMDFVLSNLDLTFTAAYWLGCSIKYIFRYKRKGKPEEDLNKSLFCYKKAIKSLKKSLKK